MAGTNPKATIDKKGMNNTVSKGSVQMQATNGMISKASADGESRDWLADLFDAGLPSTNDIISRVDGTIHDAQNSSTSLVKAQIDLLSLDSAGQYDCGEVLEPEPMIRSRLSAAAPPFVVPGARKSVGVRVTNEAGEEVDLAQLAAAKRGVPKKDVPAVMARPEDAVRRLAMAEYKDAGLVRCAAFLKAELLAHKGEWETPGDQPGMWSPYRTLRLFIVALHDKFPPSGEAPYNPGVAGWVRDVIAAIDMVCYMDIVETQSSRAVEMLTRALSERNSAKKN
ncbi:hypothetical protein GGS20DRAFT_587241 [Poronia punctata]|nr:hypothetical protein GGS20DRAFT_587241 [Poronia punctata]